MNRCHCLLEHIVLIPLYPNVCIGTFALRNIWLWIFSTFENCICMLKISNFRVKSQECTCTLYTRLQWSYFTMICTQIIDHLFNWRKYVLGGNACFMVTNQVKLWRSSAVFTIEFSEIFLDRLSRRVIRQEIGMETTFSAMLDILTLWCIFVTVKIRYHVFSSLWCKLHISVSGDKNKGYCIFDLHYWPTHHQRLRGNGLLLFY